MKRLFLLTVLFIMSVFAFTEDLRTIVKKFIQQGEYVCIKSNYDKYALKTSIATIDVDEVSIYISFSDKSYFSYCVDEYTFTLDENNNLIIIKTDN